MLRPPWPDSVTVLAPCGPAPLHSTLAASTGGWDLSGAAVECLRS